MTLQRSETLIHRGRRYSLKGTPLSSCSDPAVVQRQSQITVASTALWRGYVGTWEIKRGRLWLTGLEASVRQPSTPPDQHHERRGLDWLFPGVDGPVPADWYTGTLKSPRGRAQHSGLYSLVWPYMRLFHVEAGRVVGTELRDDRRACRAGIAKMARFRRLLVDL